jgi:hypothetical protein
MNRKRQRILKKIQKGYTYCSVTEQKGSLYYTARLYWSELVDELILTTIIFAMMGIVILWT